MKRKLINLTPHPMVISGHETIEPSGYVARINLQLCQVGDINGIPMMVSQNLGIYNLPEPQENVMYIVPSLVRQQVPERKDLCSPAKLIRNAHGGVVACSALEVNP
jgi:hypothetical protein